MIPPVPGVGPPPLPPPPARPRPAPAPRQGMHGCLIALLVAGGLAIPVAAILVAIAMPAYNDYLARSQIVAALAETAPVKVRLGEFVAQHGRCPLADEPGFGAAHAPGQAHAGVAFIATDSGCAMAIALPDTRGGPLQGKRLWLEREEDGSWRCGSDAEDRYLPADCRG
ncbi:pilin [Luteimonas sp. SDU82]|uniref:pilin n=1 Tax=Luteimonas sp. SDU82 TaxID=3422592 RepID=UPI003EB89E6D